jgi:hypothetical protein
MPHAIAFNSGSRTGQLIVSGGIRFADIEYAISSSIISGSYGISWRTPINPANNQLLLISNTFTQSVGAGGLSSNPVFYLSGVTIADLVGVSNIITAPNGTTQQIGWTGSLNRLSDTRNRSPRFVDTASAFQFLAESGKYMLVNYNYPNIVTHGLTGIFDSGFYSSYPTTGSIWYDIDGGAGIPPGTGSLFNVPTWTRTGNSGSLNFDGTDDYAALTGSYFKNPATTGTIIAWYSCSGIQQLNPTARAPIVYNSGSANSSFGWGVAYHNASGINATVNISVCAGTASADTNVSNPIAAGVFAGTATSVVFTNYIFTSVTWDNTSTTSSVAQPNLSNGGIPYHYSGSKAPIDGPPNRSIPSFETWVARRPAPATTTAYLNGQVGAIYFYNRQLSISEINTMYQNTRTVYGGT